MDDSGSNLTSIIIKTGATICSGSIVTFSTDERVEFVYQYLAQSQKERRFCEILGNCEEYPGFLDSENSDQILPS